MYVKLKQHPKVFQKFKRAPILYIIYNYNVKYSIFFYRKLKLKLLFFVFCFVFRLPRLLCLRIFCSEVTAFEVSTLDF